MDYFLFGLAIFGLFFFFQFIAISKAKKRVGQPIPEIDDENLKSKLKSSKCYLYFWSPSCSKCKYQEKELSKIKDENVEIIHINIQEENNTAKIFGILGTPTIILVDRGIIKDILVGVRSNAFLLNKFNSID